MRSLCSPLVAFVLAACANDAPDTAGGAKRQFDALEGALVSLAAAPETEWVERLETVRALPLDVPEVVAARALCVSAYEAFAEATVRLGAARAQVNDVELALEEGVVGDAGLAALAKLKDDATRSTGEVSEALDRAEELVAKCAGERRALRERLSSGGTARE